MIFNSEYSILYIVISLIIALSISYLYYRNTNLTKSIKFFLISLRGFSFFLILVLLFILYIFIEKKTTDKPINVFLFDVSKSLTLVNRKGELKKSNEIIKSLGNDKSENKYFIFSNDIIKEIELKDIKDLQDNEFSGERTNITNSLNTLAKIFGDKKISSINIVSDGIINDGGNPIYLSQQGQVLYNYLLIGDTVQKKDLVIKNIYFNPITYIESNTEIQAEFNSYNFNKNIKVKLYEEDKIIQEKDILVTSEKKSYYCSFTIKSNVEGIKKYKVELQTEEGEITNKNNEEEFFIEFISNKFKTLIVSGNPSADYSYLIESVNKINNFESKFFTLKSPTTFYEGQLPILNDFNLLVLINFPNVFTDLGLVNKMRDELKGNKTPVFFISGSNTDYEKLKLLSEYLPFTYSNKTGEDEKSGLRLISDLPEEMKNSFGIFKLESNSSEVFIPAINITPLPETQTILYSSKLFKPVLIISKSKDKSSAAFIGYNFYKWRLDINNVNKDFLSNILTGVSLSIGNKEKNKKVRINLDKQVYYPTEKIIIKGFINNIEYLDNSIIKLKIFNDSISKDIAINKTSNNTFTGEINEITKGEYLIKCILLQNNVEIASDTKRVIIKETNLEFKETKSDFRILDNLAYLNGGEKITNENINEINKKIGLKNEIEIKSQVKINKIFLNSSIIVLILIITFLSIEWFIRKRQNLP